MSRGKLFCAHPW